MPTADHIRRTDSDRRLAGDRLSLPSVRRKGHHGYFTASPLREWFGEFLSNIGSEDERRQYIEAALNLLIQKKLAPLQAGALVCALRTGRFSFKELDNPYGRLTGARPKMISALLNGYRRKAEGGAGTWHLIQQQIARHLGGKKPSNLAMAEAFHRSEKLVWRLVTTRKTFLRTLLASDLVNPDNAALILETVRAIPDKPDWKVVLNAGQLNLMMVLIEMHKNKACLSLASVSRAAGIDKKQVKNALLGQNGNPGAVTKCLKALSSRSPEKETAAQGAFEKFTSFRLLLDESELTLIEEALTAAKALEPAVSVQPMAKALVTRMIENRLAGRDCTWEECGRELGISAPVCSSLLNGRDGQRGLLDIMNETLNTEEYFASFLKEAPVLKRVSFFMLAAQQALSREASDDERETISRFFFSIVEAMKEIPSLCYFEGAERQQKRWMSNYEKRLMVLACLCSGQTAEEVSASAGKILNLSGPARLEAVSLGRFLYGRREVRHRMPGAIRVFRDLVSHKDIAAQRFDVNSNNTKRLIDLRRTVLENVVRAGSCEEIVGALFPFKRLSRGSSGYVLWMLAQRADAGLAGEFMRLALHPEYMLKPAGHPAVARAASLVLEANLNGAGAAIQSLLQLVKENVLDTWSAAAFLSALNKTAPRLAGLALMDILSACCYADSHSSLRPTARRLMSIIRASEFPLLRANELPGETLYLYVALVEADSALKMKLSEHDRALTAEVERFLAGNNIQGFIRKRCSRFLFSKSSRNGVMLHEAIDLAYEAVLRAADTYREENYGKDGRKSTFRNWAFNNIRWKLGKAFTSNVNQRKSNVQSLDAPTSGDECNLYRFLAAPGAPEEDIEDSAGVNLSSILGVLTPRQRRIVALAFSGEHTAGKNVLDYNRIAQCLYDEGLSDKIVSAERIRQMLNEALAEIKRKMVKTRPEEWDAYIERPEKRRVPPAIIVMSKGRMLAIGKHVLLSGLKVEEGTELFASLARVKSSELEMLIEVRELDTNRKIGTWTLAIKDGCAGPAEQV